MSTVVNLRDERQGRDRRALDAEIRDDGALVIRGQDLGPGTSSMSDGGEYEWADTFAAHDVPKLVAALGGTSDQPIVELLQQRYTGAGSYELERIVRMTAATIPREFWNWG
jgi:hypothetical protein